MNTQNHNVTHCYESIILKNVNGSWQEVPLVANEGFGWGRFVYKALQARIVLVAYFCLCISATQTVEETMHLWQKYPSFSFRETITCAFISGNQSPEMLVTIIIAQSRKIINAHFMNFILKTNKKKQSYVNHNQLIATYDAHTNVYSCCCHSGENQYN